LEISQTELCISLAFHALSTLVSSAQNFTVQLLMSLTYDIQIVSDVEELEILPDR